MRETHVWYDSNNSFSFLALADRARRRDRPAPFARQLATGVGGRVVAPRRDAGRVGSARLAQQARSATAQRERILGRALAATKKIGGRDVSRFALWRANAAQEQRLYCRGDGRPGARHWREYGDFQLD